jgi:hypothetical protein
MNNKFQAGISFVVRKRVRQILRFRPNPPAQFVTQSTTHAERLPPTPGKAPAGNEWKRNLHKAKRFKSSLSLRENQ